MRSTYGPVSIESDPRGLPEDNPALVQGNFPNPFSHETDILFDLQAPGRVLITVYNTLGQEVEQIADGWYTEGQHHVRWNAGDRPSGMYIYRVMTEGLLLRLDRCFI